MEDLQDIVTGLIQGSVRHYRNYQETSDRVVTDLFRGVQRDYGELGDLRRKEGRSGSMSTDIRDAVLHILPRVLEVLLSSAKVIRATATSPMDSKAADMQTEVVRHVISQDNRGFLELYNAIYDALVRDMGWIRYWWMESGPGHHGYWTTYRGLVEEQVVALITMPGVVGYDISRGPYVDGSTGLELYDCSVRQGKPGQVVIESVPNEEMFYDARARDIRTADCVAHIREIAADRVVALGYDPDVVGHYAGRSSTFEVGGGMHSVRDFADDHTAIHEDESRQVVTFADAWIRVDLDGDGIGELRHFHCIGPQYDILNDHGVPVSRAPVCQFRPIVEPHTMQGLGFGTLLADVQMQKSLLERGLMNAQARALDPRLIIKEDAVRYEDAIATGLHQPIRVLDHHNIQDAVGEVKSQYMGDAALQGLSYLNEKRADRSGMARAAEGKDAAALQSTTQQAVSETFARADTMTILVIRMFAETGMLDLYSGISEMLEMHQDYARRIQLDDGRFMDVDPRAWMKGREWQVNVRGWDTSREIEFLAMILEAQNGLLQRQSPLINEVHIGNTIRSLFRATGRTNVSDYVAPWGMEDQANYEAQMQIMMAQQPPAIEQQVVDVEKAKMMLEHDRETAAKAVDATLKELEIEAKNKTDIAREQIKANVQLYSAQLTRGSEASSG